MAQVILNRKASSRASPTIYYTVEVEQIARTVNDVTLQFTVTSDLQYDSSNKGTGYTMTGGVYVGGAWHDIVLKQSNVTWVGSNDPYTAKGTITVSGLTAVQTAVEGVKFRVVSSNTTYNGGTLDATACDDITIDRYGGIGYVGGKAALTWRNVGGEWHNALPWANDNGTWKEGV